MLNPVKTILMKSECPHCGRNNDATTGLSGEGVPTNGAVSVCWHCGGVGIFDDSNSNGVRLPYFDELIQVWADPDFIEAMIARMHTQTPHAAVGLMRKRQ